MTHKAADYIEANERHQLYVHRFTSQMINEYINTGLIDSYNSVRLLLADLDLRWTRREQAAIQKAVAKAIQATMSAAWANVMMQYELFAVAEAAFAANALATFNDVKPIETAQQKIIRYATESLMSMKDGDLSQVGTWGDFVQANTDAHVRTYDSIIRGAFAKGRIDTEKTPTIAQITKQLRDKTNGLLKTQAETLARTGIIHYASQANRAFAEDNKDIIEREVPLVTFDNRTSNICLHIGAQYGERGWLVGKSPIGYPSYHWSCRTVIVYLTKGQKSLKGTRAAVGGVNSPEAQARYERRNAALQARREAGEKAASQVRYRGRKDTEFKAGQIPANTKIDDWLIRQPVWFIESTLGKKMAKAFIDGQISLKDVADSNLRPMSYQALVEAGKIDLGV